MTDEIAELSWEDLRQRYEAKPAPTLDVSQRRSPFKFLDSYDVGDSDIFFGRDSEIDELLRHFHSYGHVLIYGESGCGKSSLVQCGLRSRIQESDALFIPLRVHTTGLPTLCHQIRESASHELGEVVEAEIDAGLLETLAAVREAASRPLVLFFDQFEELFLFHDQETRRHFANEIASLHKARLNIKVIIGIRQDYLAHLSELEETVAGVFDNRFWLRRMSRENAAEAVVQACGTCDVTIDNDLSESILHRLDPGGQGVELPYLQVVMDRLYRQAVEANPAQPVISAADVEKLGDIANILGSFLVEEVAKLPSPDTGRQILKAFVTREATRRTLDRAAVGQESAGFGAAIPPDVLDTHLNQLVNVRILRDIADSGTYELRHDALATTVSGWISEVEKELIEVRDNLINRFKEHEARGFQTSTLLDQDFMDYLAVYQKRLVPLLSEHQLEYLHHSEQRLFRAKRVRQIALFGSIATGLAVVILGWMYLQHRETQEARARLANFNIAKQAVTDMLSVVGSDSLKDVPQMEPVRAVLLDKALQLFKDISANDAIGRSETADAHYQVGEIQRILGDNSDNSEQAYRTAIAELEALVAKFPTKGDYQQQLARSHMGLGRLFEAYERFDEAQQQYDSAIKIQRALASDDNLEYRIDLARSLMNRGIVRKKTSKTVQDHNRAMADYDEAQDLLAELPTGEIDGVQDELRRVLLSKIHNNRGNLLRVRIDKEGYDANLLQQSRRAYNDAIQLLTDVIETRRAKNKPPRVEYGFNLAKYYSSLAILLFKFDASAKQDALKKFSMAVDLGKSLNVGTREVRVELAKYYNNKATALKKEEPAEAIAQWERAVEVLDTLDDEKAAATKKSYQEEIDKLLEDAE